MGLKEKIRILGFQPIAGYAGTEEGDIFNHYIKTYGIQNIFFVCSMAYNLGRIRGMQGQRKKIWRGGLEYV